MDHGGGSPAQQPIEISISPELARARAATARYATDLDAAKAAGYRIITPMMPDMGYHFMNPAVQGFDIEKPPILVYERSGDGWQLGALEWVFPKKPDDAAASTARPTARSPPPATTTTARSWRRRRAVGLRPRRARRPVRASSSGTRDLVTMHVWLWYPNPDGLFSSTNPLVTPFDEPARPAPRPRGPCGSSAGRRPTELDGDQLKDRRQRLSGARGLVAAAVLQHRGHDRDHQHARR